MKGYSLWFSDSVVEFDDVSDVGIPRIRALSENSCRDFSQLLSSMINPFLPLYKMSVCGKVN